MYTILALFGKSGSGKDTVLKSLKLEIEERWLEDKFNFIISSTTRPKRDYEENGVDYFFLKEEEMMNEILQNKILEASVFNGWVYAIPSNSLVKDKINIGIFNPTSILTLLENEEINVIPVLIDCSDKERFIRTLKREKEPDINEIFRRYKSEREDFEMIHDDEIVYTINNTNSLPSLNNQISDLIGRVLSFPTQ